MDQRDRRLISYLQKDGRASLAEISNELSVSSMAVKKRLEKLQQNDVKVGAQVNTESLNVILAILVMEMESYDAIKKMLNTFKSCPRIIKFFVTTGSYNLFALIFTEDYHSLESVSLERCSLRNQEGVKRFEIYPIQETAYDPFIEIKIDPDKDLEYAPCGVYCGDCSRYEAERCLGCPSTKFYRGKL